MIPEGTYNAQACEPLEFVKSSKKLTPGVSVLMRIMGDTPVAGATLVWSSYFGEAMEPGKMSSTERIAESLALMGYDGNDVASVMRLPVKIVVEHEEYEGQTRVRIRYINDPNGVAGGFVQMSPAEVASAKDKLRAIVLSKKSVVTPAMKTVPKF